MSLRIYCLLSGFIFAAVGVFHFLRLINNWPVTLGTWQVPMAPSVGGLLIATGLSAWAFLLAKTLK